MRRSLESAWPTTRRARQRLGQRAQIGQRQRIDDRDRVVEGDLHDHQLGREVFFGVKFGVEPDARRGDDALAQRGERGGIGDELDVHRVTTGRRARSAMVEMRKVHVMPFCVGARPVPQHRRRSSASASPPTASAVQIGIAIADIV